MDLASIITIVVGAIIIYFVIKFVVSPLIKAIAGIIALLLLIYIIQYFFGFNLDRFFGPLATYLDITKWGINLSWLLNPLNYYLNKFIPK